MDDRHDVCDNPIPGVYDSLGGYYSIISVNNKVVTSLLLSLLILKHYLSV